MIVIPIKNLKKNPNAGRTSIIRPAGPVQVDAMVVGIFNKGIFDWNQHTMPWGWVVSYDRRYDVTTSPQTLVTRIAARLRDASDANLETFKSWCGENFEPNFSYHLNMQQPVDPVYGSPEPAYLYGRADPLIACEKCSKRFRFSKLLKVEGCCYDLDVCPKCGAQVEYRFETVDEALKRGAY